MLHTSFLKSILPRTGDEAEARPKVNTPHPPRQLAELLGAFLSQGRDTTRAVHHFSFPKECCGLSALWKPFFFPSPPLRQRGCHGCPRPRGEQERAWWRLPHRTSCLVPVLSPHSHLASAPQVTPQSHLVTELKIQKGLQDSRTNMSPLGALQTRTFPLSPPFPVCICSICPRTRLTSSPASRVCAAGDTKLVLSVSEPQLPSQGSSALPHCFLSTFCMELICSPSRSLHTSGRCRHQHKGTGTP